jgi:hypothetical protein
MPELTCATYSANEPAKLCTKTVLTTWKTDYDYDKDKAKVENIHLFDPVIDTDNSIIELCEKNGNDYLPKCITTQNSPWFDEYNGKACTAKNNISIEPKIFIDVSKNTNYPIYKTPKSKIFHYIENKGVCENKWYDWFTIHNYHIGNYYSKVSPNENDVYICYKPCDNIRSIPYDNGSCIPKSIASGGIYKNTIDFTPLALIMLIGSTYQDLFDHYVTIQNIQMNNLPDKLIDIDVDLLNKIVKKTNWQYHNNEYRNKNNTFNIKDKDVIIKANDARKDCIRNKILINNDLKSTHQPSELKKEEDRVNFENAILTYKTPSFKAPDVNMQDKIFNLGLLNSEYINKCYQIAYYTNKEDKLKFKEYTTEFDKVFKKKYKEEESNPDISEKLKTITRTPISENYKFNIHYRIACANDYNIEDYHDFKRIKRLANIFKKAVNICFDGKSDFSKYIIQNITLDSKNLDPNMNRIEYVVYEDNYYDYEIDECSNNEDFIYDESSKKYKCVAKSQSGTYNLINNAKKKQPEKQVYYNLDGDKLYTHEKKITKEEIDKNSAEIESKSFFKMPDYLELIYKFYHYLNILFVIFILVLINVLTNGWLMTLCYQILNFLYRMGVNAFYFFWDVVLSIFSDTGFAKYDYDVARVDRWGANYTADRVRSKVTGFEGKIEKPPSA